MEGQNKKKQQVKLEDVLGYGSSGVVHRGKWCGLDVAVKKLFRPHDPSEAKYVEREMEALQQLKHPNIVEVLQFDFQENGDIAIITELAKNGSLENILLNPEYRMNWPMVLSILKDITLAMVYLHSNNMWHRDLKSANILITEGWKAKVCDFGLARKGTVDPSVNVGTMLWMAPEVLLERKDYDHHIDIFSFGMIIYEMVFLCHPPRRKVIETFRFVPERFESLLPKDIPDGLWQLLCQCCDQEPANRPEFTRILNRIETLLQAVKGKPQCEYEKLDEKEKKRRIRQRMEDRNRKVDEKLNRGEGVIRYEREKEKEEEEAQLRELKVRSMKELVWRAERLGYKRRGEGEKEEVEDLIHFITERTKQRIHYSASPVAQHEAYMSPRLFRQESITLGRFTDMHRLLHEMNRLSSLKPPKKEGSAMCILCLDVVENAKGHACMNEHFVCLNCHIDWLDFELNEGRVGLRCPALAACPCRYHPTTYFGLLGAAAENLRKKWEATTLQLWRRQQGFMPLRLLLVNDAVEDEKEIILDCTNCTHYVYATVELLKQQGGIVTCYGCGAVSCHLCLPAVKVANSETEYYDNIVGGHGHEHHQDFRFIWQEIVEEILTGCNLATCPECKNPGLKDEGCNCIACGCGARFCFICSAKLPSDGALAHDTFNEDEHHNPARLCKLWEADETAQKEKACVEILKAFRNQTKCTPEQLMEYCRGMLKEIDFQWNWWE